MRREQARTRGEPSFLSGREDGDGRRARTHPARPPRPRRTTEVRRNCTPSRWRKRPCRPCACVDDPESVTAPNSDLAVSCPDRVELAIVERNGVVRNAVIHLGDDPRAVDNEYAITSNVGDDARRFNGRIFEQDRHAPAAEVLHRALSGQAFAQQDESAAERGCRPKIGVDRSMGCRRPSSLCTRSRSYFPPLRWLAVVHCDACQPNRARRTRRSPHSGPATNSDRTPSRR